MYVAHFGDGVEKFSQVQLRFPIVVFEPATHPQRWQLGLENAVEQLLASPHVDFAYRIGVANHCLHRALLVIVPAEHEGQLGYLVAAFLQLNTVAADSVDLCLSRDDHDALLRAFPAHRAWVRNESYQVDEQELACDFMVLPMVTELLGLALQQDWDFAVQVNVRRFLPSPEDLRVVRKNLVRLEADAPGSQAVLELQRQIVARMGRAQFMIDQFLGAGTTRASRVMLARLEHRFAADYGRLGLAAPPLEEDADAVLEAPLTTGFHSCLFEEPSPMAKAAMAVDRALLKTYLTWHPPETWDPKLLANAAGLPDTQYDLLRRMENQLGRIERGLDARRLEKATCEEFRKALVIHRSDPPFALVKARQILEEIIKRVYQDQKKSQQVKPLFNMIEELVQAGTVFPRNISSYLHTVRVLGNLVVHSGSAEHTPPLSAQDLELSLLMTLNIVEWYLLHYISTP